MYDLSAEDKFLKGRILSVEDRSDETKQYSRRNCVEIQGMPIQNSEVIQTIKDVGKTLRTNIKDSIIVASMGRNHFSKDHQVINVKFVRKLDADDMMRKITATRNFSTRYLNLTSDNPIYSYVNELLTPTRRRIRGMARQERIQKGNKWLWVRGVKIFLRIIYNGLVYY